MRKEADGDERAALTKRKATEMKLTDALIDSFVTR
jgi:hypothetical protein